MNNSEYKARREKILSKLENNSVAILFSGVAKTMSADATYPFEVNRNFYYLTGIEQEHSALVLIKSDGERKEFLFVDEYSEIKEKWTGRRITLDEAKDISGVSNTFIYNSLETKLDTILDLSCQYYGEINNLYLDLTKELKIAEEYSTKDASNALKNKYNHLQIHNIFPLIMNERMVKSPFEISLMREAIKITHRGILKMMKEVHDDMFEYNLSNIFAYSIMNEGTHQFAFPTIVASGKNATCLHYPTPFDQIQHNDLILCDLGSAYHNYCSDITRTFPCSGKFTDLQKTIYSIVLGCNKHIIEMIKPGITIKELQEETVSYLSNGLLEAGLINKKEDISMYYYHGVSHHLGLDTHDVSDRERPLEPGMVITVEPGLYFKEHSIGIRIEDDVLVTNTGSENLSIDIPKEIHDIEKLMSTRN